MRTVKIPFLGLDVPVIGFGCASLGSRVSEAQGRAAFEAAYAAGIRWFDVAPSYGDGEAEALLGSFVESKDARLVICTKVGMVAAGSGLASRIVKPAARLAVRMAPGLRRLVARSRPQPTRRAITPELIESSVEESLRRLRRDYVDVIALHEPTVEEATDAAVLGCLERLIRKGWARTAGIAGHATAVIAGLRVSEVYGVAQIVNNPLHPELARLRSINWGDRRPFIVTHSVFGADGPLSVLNDLLRRRPEVLEEMRARGYGGSAADMASAALLDYALASNSGGVVLISSFRPDHLASNLARADKEPNLTMMELLDKLMSGATADRGR